MIILAGAMQMTGDVAGARRLLKASLSEAAANSESHPTFRIRLLLAQAFLNWMDADLIGLRSAAGEAISLGETTGLREVLTVSRCMLAAAYYHRNELDLVRETVAPALFDKSFANTEFQGQSLALASLTHQLRGEREAALEMADILHDIALASHNTFTVEVAEGFRAELAMRQGRMAEAKQWADQYQGFHLAPTYAFYSPSMTLLKVLVLENSEESRLRAATLLDKLVAFLDSKFQKRFLAETLALRSLLREGAGDIDAATEDLAAAISIAQPSRFLRLFADLGPRLGRLLSRLDLDEEGLTYVGEILAALAENPDPRVAAGVQPTAMKSVDALSRREEQVLSLLADRLSNKEIADRLNISTVTVKRHVANIFQKLDVHARRQAVAKAQGLGLIRTP
jgi:LuxR family maltose regulon positive regulatory protein